MKIQKPHIVKFLKSIFQKRKYNRENALPFLVMRYKLINCLKILNHAVALELADMLARSEDLRRHLTYLQGATTVCREDLIEFDEECMDVDEALFRRLELRNIIQILTDFLENDCPETRAFIKEENLKDDMDQWVFFTNSLLIDNQCLPDLNLETLIYPLSVFLEDLRKYQINNYAETSPVNLNGFDRNSDLAPPVHKKSYFKNL